VNVFESTDGAWVCGHWNGSPVEILVTALLRDVPEDEVYHHHPYHEYFVILEGSGTLLVAGVPAEARASKVVMIEPEEPHRWTHVGAEGIRWVVIKERSEPGSKMIVDEP
jgi:mannose-6-phosphate isomerase-like protein (cupin superfamily)